MPDCELDYPDDISPNTQYVGSFPELGANATVKVNGASVPATKVPCGQGWTITIAAEYIVLNGVEPGEVEISDGTHTYTTTIK